MKALVLYRSYHGNTKQVADAIVKELVLQNVESTVQDLRRKLPDLSGFDVILIGSPTRMARVNRRARRVLKRIAKKGFVKKPIAVFDTYGPVPTDPQELEKGKKWLYPGAAGILHKVAETQGLNVYSKTLRCEVTGLKGPLGENELEKAASFAKEFVSSFGDNPERSQ
jgi:flavodoxin